MPSRPPDRRASEATQSSLGGTSDDHQHETALPLRGAMEELLLARRISTARRRAGFLRGVAERSNAARYAACEWREPSGKRFLCAVPHVDPNIWVGGEAERNTARRVLKEPLLLLSKGGDYARAYRSDSGRHPRAVCGRVLPGQGDALTRNDPGGWRWRTAKCPHAASNKVWCDPFCAPGFLLRTALVRREVAS
jgi:hypothetical protein